MTVLAVSHRAVAFERADQVLRMDAGRDDGRVRRDYPSCRREMGPVRPIRGRERHGARSRGERCCQRRRRPAGDHPHRATRSSSATTASTAWCSSACSAAACGSPTRSPRCSPASTPATRCRSARSTSASTATTSACGPIVPGSVTDIPVTLDGAHGGARRRRAVHRPHRARRARGAERLRPPARGAAGGHRRPRPPRAADPPRLRRQEPADQSRRDGRRHRRRGGARDEAPARHRRPRPPTTSTTCSSSPITWWRSASRPIPKVPALRGKNVVSLFFEDSHPHAHQLRHRGASGSAPTR